MKRFLFILGIVVMSGGIFVGGLILGIQRNFMNAIVVSSSLGDDISKASTELVLLYHLEAQEIDEAKAFLNIQLNGNIIGIDSLLPLCPDGDSTLAAKNLLARIAEHRSKHPVKSDEEIDKVVQNILAKSRTWQSTIPKKLDFYMN
jgi:hypothetical protein